MWALGPSSVLNLCPAVCGLQYCNLFLGVGPALLDSSSCIFNIKITLTEKKKKSLTLVLAVQRRHRTVKKEVLVFHK